jgi:outer membrane receptor for ferrienterochelin and colicin
MSYKQVVTQNKHVLNLTTGYTYSLPIEVDRYLGYNLDKIGPYMKALFQYMVKPVTGDTASYVLKYRNRHLITLDLEYVYDNKLSMGVNARYYSNLENFDKLFLAIPGAQYQEYYSTMPKHGNWVVDTRVFYTLKNKHTFGFIVKNMFNREYWMRVGKLESPRSVTFQYRLEI